MTRTAIEVGLLRRAGRLLSLLALSVLYATPAAAEVWQLEADPAATEIGFTLDATLHTVEGSAQLLEGSLVFDPESGSAAGRFAVDAVSLESGNDRRDRDMHAKVLDSGRHPRIVFEAESVDGEFGAEGEFELRLGGAIEIHGGEHPLTLVVRGTKSGNQVEAVGTFEVPYVEWGMKDPSKFVLRVAKEVEITVELAAEVRRMEKGETSEPR